ncbi:phospholipase [Streptococcus pluranimalium]|uniref:phospholipase n=1 Tax=Streptococcus pluranimalium TaxID=82348 RepID=UPI0039FD06A5
MSFWVALVLLVLNTQKIAASEVDIYQQYALDVQSYLVVEQSWVYFNLEQAQEDGLSQEVIDFGMALEQFSQEYNTAQFSNRQLRNIVWEVHGHYCGPGHDGNNFTASPQDLLDEGCRRHDLCFQGMGFRRNCQCNKELVDYIDRNYHAMPDGAKWKATLIKSYFATAGQLGC